MKTVKEVSRLAGVSIRTLRYYDELDLLKPTAVTEAGYRLYSDKDLERLQEIMFFKEMEFPLEKIKQLLEDPSIDRQEMLLMQQAVLEKKRNRLNGIIELIQDVRKGVNTMSFEAFNGDDIEKIVEHTIRRAKPEDINMFVEKFGSMEAFREELAKNLKDPETEAHLIKLYGGKDKICIGLFTLKAYIGGASVCVSVCTHINLKSDLYHFDFLQIFYFYFLFFYFLKGIMPF